MMQEVMNEPMQRLRDSAQDLIQHGVILHDELREILEGGLTVVDGCVYFTTALAANGHLSREEMGALGHQSLVNKLHLDFYLDDVQPEEWDRWCVAQGILLAHTVLIEAEKTTNLPIDVVITLDEGGAQPPYANYAVVSFTQDSGDLSGPNSTFRFYVHRDGDNWIEDNKLNEMLDAIMIVRR